MFDRNDHNHGSLIVRLGRRGVAGRLVDAVRRADPPASAASRRATRRSRPSDPGRAGRRRASASTGAPGQLGRHAAVSADAGPGRREVLPRALRDLARLLGVQQRALRAQELPGQARQLRSAARASRRPRRASRAATSSRPSCATRWSASSATRRRSSRATRRRRASAEWRARRALALLLLLALGGRAAAAEDRSVYLCFVPDTQHLTSSISGCASGTAAARTTRRPPRCSATRFTCSGAYCEHSPYCKGTWFDTGRQLLRNLAYDLTGQWEKEDYKGIGELDGATAPRTGPPDHPRCDAILSLGDMIDIPSFPAPPEFDLREARRHGLRLARSRLRRPARLAEGAGRRDRRGLLADHPRERRSLSAGARATTIRRSCSAG